MGRGGGESAEWEVGESVLRYRHANTNIISVIMRLTDPPNPS